MQFNRREAIQLLSIGGMIGPGLITSREGLIAQAGANGVERAMTLSIGNYGMQKVPPRQVIDRLAKLGYDGVELCVREEWPTAPSQLNTEARGALRKRLRDQRLRVTAMMEHLPPMPGDLAEGRESERLKTAADLARDLIPDDIPLIQTVLGGGDWEKQRDFFRDRIAKWVEIARAHHFRIAIKPHRGGAMSRPSDAKWIIKQVGEPDELGLVYDYSHYAFRDITVEDSITEAAGSILHVAIKDVTVDEGAYRFSLPGTNTEFDYIPLFQGLARLGYRSDICCEVSSMVWQREGYDPLQAAEQCYQAMAPIMQEAGVRN